MTILMSSKYFETWDKYSTLKESTKRGYESHLRKFERYVLNCGMVGELDFDRFYFLEDKGNYESIDVDFIDGYVSYLKEIGSSDHVMYAAITSLKSFFCFIEDMGLIKSNPLRYYVNPYYKPTLSDRSINKEECKKLLIASYHLDPFLKQYYLLILLMISCGLRAKELCSLKRSQIRFDTGMIVINKGQKTDIDSVAMPKALKEAFETYIAHPKWVEWSRGRDKEVFFHQGEALTYQVLRGILKQISIKAGLKRELTPHQFRHTMAHLMLDSGIHLATIKRQLRHKKIWTTLRYLPQSVQFGEI